MRGTRKGREGKAHRQYLPKAACLGVVPCYTQQPVPGPKSMLSSLFQLPVQAIAAGALDLVPTFAPAQLVSLAASFGTLHFAHGPLYAAIARQALPGVAALSPQQRADLLLAYAVLVRGLALIIPPVGCHSSARACFSRAHAAGEGSGGVQPLCCATLPAAAYGF